jgi:protein associated with RNAse G/E
MTLFKIRKLHKVDSDGKMLIDGNLPRIWKKTIVMYSFSKHYPSIPDRTKITDSKPQPG